MDNDKFTDSAIASALRIGRQIESKLNGAVAAERIISVYLINVAEKYAHDGFSEDAFAELCKDVYHSVQKYKASNMN